MTRVCLSLLLLVPGSLALAQPAAPELTGVWVGSGRFTNEWGKAACTYVGGDRPAVRLELAREGDRTDATLTLEIPGTLGAACPPLRKRYEIGGVTVSGGSLSFTDPAGQQWNLGVRGDALEGLVAWKAGLGGDEPVAEGFRDPAGESPLLRLSGEVALKRRQVAEQVPSVAPAGAPAGAPARPAKASKGGAVAGVVALVTANVVGVGAILGANRLLQESTDTGGGQKTCSPRSCIVGLPGQGCDCGGNQNIVSGASCGTTASGVAFGGTCRLPDLPCAASFSCNGGRCEDSTGSCPF